jgi:hypothetical protein
MLARMHAWARRFAAVKQQLGPERAPMPAGIDLGAPLYFLPAPRVAPDLSKSEMALVRHGENGASASDLLDRAGLGPLAGRRALASLIEKGVLTLSMGRAGDPWKWRALLPRDVQVPGMLPVIVRVRHADASVPTTPVTEHRAPPPCLARVEVRRATTAAPALPSGRSVSAPPSQSPCAGRGPLPPS